MPLKTGSPGANEVPKVIKDTLSGSPVGPTNQQSNSKRSKKQASKKEP
jgi:hypothetical protein